MEMTEVSTNDVTNDNKVRTNDVKNDRRVSTNDMKNDRRVSTNEIKNDNKVIKTDSMMEVIGNVLVIRISGELDHHNSVEIRNNADEIICKRRIIHILFDFEKTDFMDSSGIGVIMGRYKKVKDFGGSMGAVNTKNNIDKILLYSGLNKIVKHYDSIESAIEEMKGGNQIG